jgi:hypothetical protein
MTFTAAFTCESFLFREIGAGFAQHSRRRSGGESAKTRVKVFSRMHLAKRIAGFTPFVKKKSMF